MADTSVKKLAAKLSIVGSKKQLDSKDLDMLREVKEGIVAVLQGLKECDVCGSAVTEIVRIEIDGIRAAVCQSCGIKSLKNKAIVLRGVKKKEHSKEKVAKSASHGAASHSRAPEKKRPFSTDPHPASERPSHGTPALRAEQPSLFSEPASAEKGENAFEEVARDANSKMMTVKKVHQIVSNIAFPMNFERTTSYVRMEAQGQNLHLNPDELKRIVTALIKKNLIKIKE